MLAHRHSNNCFGMVWLYQDRKLIWVGRKKMSEIHFLTHLPRDDENTHIHIFIESHIYLFQIMTYEVEYCKWQFSVELWCGVADVLYSKQCCETESTTDGLWLAFCPSEHLEPYSFTTLFTHTWKTHGACVYIVKGQTWVISSKKSCQIFYSMTILVKIFPH